jgi:disulfide bond formation protein DsbB
LKIRRGWCWSSEPNAMNWFARHRRRLAITFVAFIGAISAAPSGFSGGRVTQHHLDLGGGSNWNFLNDESNVAVWLLVLALVCGAAFLVLVWREASGNGGRLV